jgi:hypothetical protein
MLYGAEKRKFTGKLNLYCTDSLGKIGKIDHSSLFCFDYQ